MLKIKSRLSLQLAIVLSTCKLLQFLDRKHGKSSVTTPSPDPRITIQARSELGLQNVTMLEMTETSLSKTTSPFKLRVPRWRKRSARWRPSREPYAIAYRQDAIYPNRTDENKTAGIGVDLGLPQPRAPESISESTATTTTTTTPAGAAAAAGAATGSKRTRTSVRSLGGSVKNFVRGSIKNRTRTIRGPDQSQLGSPPSAPSEIELDDSDIPTGHQTFSVGGPSRGSQRRQSQQTLSVAGLSRAVPPPGARRSLSSAGQLTSRQTASPVAHVDGAITPPVVSRFI